MMFIDQIEEVSPDFIFVKGEQSIVLKKKGDQEKDGRVVLTSSVSTASPLLPLLTMHLIAGRDRSQRVADRTHLNS